MAKLIAIDRPTSKLFNTRVLHGCALVLLIRRVICQPEIIGCRRNCAAQYDLHEGFNWMKIKPQHLNIVEPISTPFNAFFMGYVPIWIKYWFFTQSTSIRWDYELSTRNRLNLLNIFVIALPSFSLSIHKMPDYLRLHILSFHIIPYEKGRKNTASKFMHIQ